jgi:hypothetical protein
MNDLILEETVIYQYGYDLNGLPTDVMQMSPILSLIKTQLIKISQPENKTSKVGIHPTTAQKINNTCNTKQCLHMPISDIGTVYVNLWFDLGTVTSPTTSICVHEQNFINYKLGIIVSQDLWYAVSLQI